MATVTLSRYECNRDLFPDVCAVCGAPAKNRVRMTYSWHPPWSALLIVGPALMTRRMSVRLPLCDRHLRNRRRRRVAIVVTLLAILAFGALSVVYTIVRPDGPDEDVSGSLLGISTTLIFAWIIGATVAQLNDIEPAEITDRSLTLRKVSGLFVMAVESARARRRDEPDADWRYDDVRDDYDDQRHSRRD